MTSPNRSARLLASFRSLPGGWKAAIVGLVLLTLFAAAGDADPPQPRVPDAQPRVAISTETVTERVRELRTITPAPAPAVTVTVTVTEVAAAPAPPAPAPEPAPQPVPPPAAPAVSYANCDEARAASVAPLYRGDRGYSSRLDRDDDGIACE